MPSAGGGWLAGETVTVSQFGARVALRGTSGKLANGDTVSILIQRARQSRTGRVVWLDPSNTAHCGIEIEQPRGFWGIYFPGSEDDPMASGEVTKEQTVSVAWAGEAVALPPCVPGERAPGVSAAPQVMGLVSGISAIYSSFSEPTMLMADAPDELTGFLATPLKPGARVRIAANSRFVHAVVLAAGHPRAGKSLVRLKVTPSAVPLKAN